MVIKEKYKCVRIRPRGIDTENMLNVLANDGWKVVCSYAWDNQWLILSKDGK